ncbi:hypothetical protein [Halopenitus sp. POP-27]|uniref:hypothetical protein n=1 Tax=Halopenitus sp. POP-27 TaxID=2994425 RepID=UPI002469A65E|nr:hypothetical protein [Halopenitus sp. POP-27]
MGRISVHIPDELADQLESYLEAERLDRHTGIRTLLSKGIDEWRREHALKRLEAGEVSVIGAAEISGVSPWELARIATERDVTWVSEEHLRDDLEDLLAVTD